MPFAMGYLLSYPRSGNHLVRGLIEALTQRPTSSRYTIADDHLPLTQRNGTARSLGIDLSLPPQFIKVHRLAHLGDRIDRSAPLVFLMRDPFECISSDFRGVPHLILRISGRWRREWDKVVENVREFDGWQAPKLLLHYEDLAAAPAASIRGLGRFLAVDEGRIEAVVAGFGDVRGSALRSLARQPRSHADPSYYRSRAWFPARLVAPAGLGRYFERYGSVG